MPTWTLDLVIEDDSAELVLEGGIFTVSSEQLVDLIDMGKQANGYWLYAAKCQNSSGPTPLRINATSTIQNLEKEISLEIDMFTAPDGYNLINDNFRLSLGPDGRTVTLSTDYTLANLTVPSDYYAILTIETTLGATLPTT